MAEDWKDPDDAPELSETWFANAELKEGSQVVKQGSLPRADRQTLEVLRKVAQQFRQYEASHRSKNNEDGLRKAEANRGMAAMVEREIQRLDPPTGAIVMRIIPNPLSAATQVVITPNTAQRGQAEHNHGGQSLERLNARGGVSWCELAAIMGCRPYHHMSTADAERECQPYVTAAL